MNKEQLERWRSRGFDFPGAFYDGVAERAAKAAPPKTLTIEFASSRSDNEYYYLKFTFKAVGLENRDAQLYVKEINNALGFINNKTIYLKGEHNSYELKIGKVVIDSLTGEFTGVKLRGYVVCDGLYAETKVFNVQRKDVVKQYKPNKCLCKKAVWSADDLRYIVTQLRKRDDIKFQKDYDEIGNPYFADENGEKVQSNDRGKAPKKGYKFYYMQTSLYDRDDDVDKKTLKDRIFFYNSDKEENNINYNLDAKYANYEDFSKYLNKVFKDYGITNCIQRMHFLAQIYVETNRFRTTYEDKPKTSYSGGIDYRGRGMKQITHDYNYLEYYDVRKGKEKNLYTLYRNNRLENFDPKKGEIFAESVVAFYERTNNKFISVEQMNDFKDFINLLSTSIYWACDSAGWYWDKVKLNEYATEDDNAIIIVSAKVNNPSASKNSSATGINQFTERKRYFESLKEIFDYENCK